MKRYIKTKGLLIVFTFKKNLYFIGLFKAHDSYVVGKKLL